MLKDDKSQKSVTLQKSSWVLLTAEAIAHDSIFILSDNYLIMIIMMTSLSFVTMKCSHSIGTVMTNNITDMLGKMK